MITFYGRNSAYAHVSLQREIQPNESWSCCINVSILSTIFSLASGQISDRFCALITATFASQWHSDDTLESHGGLKWFLSLFKLDISTCFHPAKFYWDQKVFFFDFG